MRGNWLPRRGRRLHGGLLAGSLAIVLGSGLAATAPAGHRGCGGLLVVARVQLRRTGLHI